MVREPSSASDIWWGGASPNHPMEEDAFLANRRRGVEYLNNAEAVFVVDAFANWDHQVTAYSLSAITHQAPVLISTNANLIKSK